MESSAWRLGDAAVFGRLVVVADELLAELLRASGAESAPSLNTRAEAVRLRETVDAVDGFDRAVVEALTDQLRERLNVLRDTS